MHPTWCCGAQKRLQVALVNHSFPNNDGNSPLFPSIQLQHPEPSILPIPHTALASGSGCTDGISPRVLNDADDKAQLIEKFGNEDAAADEILGYDDEEELAPEKFDDEFDAQTLLDIENDNGKDEENELDGLEGRLAANRSRRRLEESDEDFQTRVRLEETKHAEKDYCAGGIKTQNAMLIQYQSQIKKLFFSALCIRKEQDARNPALRLNRLAIFVHVWNCVKGRMNEALQQVWDGLVPAEDAPNIVSNMFLDTITEEQRTAIGKGFLMHRELINGHLCWTAQNSSGNRSDNFRAL
ncbi:hypothetical protein CVT24_005889 [Panaeolus cyanescens]|uniref:Uncharacterized protein n=1 Tax=Panaeolus cyanescens TaxID=181874 RepID=A0A409WZL9_9AGAR|nr:hypothetical protein CVT24_005889 [Panaeolus cyanescens]